jgi:outer membrane protein assembly factor BamB
MRQGTWARWRIRLPSVRLAGCGKSPPWPFSTKANLKKAKVFRGSQPPHPAADDFIYGLLAVPTLVGVMVALTTAAGVARADDWTHWRGPEGNGTAPGATPPTAFGADTNVRWKASIPGRGSSSPIVLGDAVFVTTAVPPGERPGPFDFRLLCIDRGTGAVRWSRSAVKAVPHEGTHETNGFASASPCTDGERVYAHFGSRGLFCFTLDGTPVWQRDLGDMQIRNGFGEGSSPTLAGALIIVPWDHEGPSMLHALDARTGRTVWSVPRDEPTSWATPLVVADADGTSQVIMNGENAARGYDLATGRELWRCGGQTVRPCASAVAADGVAYVGSGFRGAFMGAFDLAGRGDLAGGRHVRWTQHRDTPDVASPLLSRGRLYYYKEKTGLLTCLDARTGTPHYTTARLPGVSRTYASPVAAGGHVYLTDRSGTITVIEDGPALRVVATNDMGEGVDATPAPVDDELFVRGERHLFCLGLPSG